MQRETYERAGLEAHARGELRSRNPFVRSPDAAFLDAETRDRMRLLAEHWWDGWDSWGKNTKALRNR